MLLLEVFDFGSCSSPARTLSTPYSDQVMRIPSTGLIQQVDFVHVSGVPNHLYGGPMLGIAFKPDSNESSTSKHTCRFYDWRTRECYSSEFPAPRWMKWSWEGDLCALAYSSHVLICDASEHFMPIASVPIFEAVSGAWETCQFYVTTPKAVECIVAPRLVDKSDNNPQRSVQVGHEQDNVDDQTTLLHLFPGKLMQNKKGIQ